MGEGAGVARNSVLVHPEGSTAVLLGRRCDNANCLQREGVAALASAAGGQGQFKRCGACKSVLYCSAHCQVRGRP